VIGSFLYPFGRLPRDSETVSDLGPQLGSCVRNAALSGARAVDYSFG